MLHERLGLGDARGAREPGDTRTYDASGQALSGNEYPGMITRTSGSPQRERLLRLESGSGSMWFQISTMPLERTSDGWGVLTIGADVTATVDDREAAQRAAAVRGALVEASTKLVDGQVTRTELVELLRAPMAMLVPDGNVTLMQQDGNEFEMTSIHHGFGAAARAGRAHLSSIMLERWRGPEALASLMATHPEANGLDGWQIESLELAGRLVRAALYSDESWSERRSA